MSYSILLENLITDLGGCGLYQWLLASIIHFGRTMAVWSTITMVFAGQDPGFLCSNDQVGTNETSVNNNINTTNNNRNESHIQTCATGGRKCTDYIFKAHMRTVVSEFDLVCDQKWIPATITTIQMGGVLLGSIIAGHLGDMIGRKPTYFLAILIMVVFNIAGYFSPSWQVYAALRFLIGTGIGFYLTVQYSFTSEFASAKWRPIIVTTPSWALGAGVFALVAWGLRDWKKIHLTISIIGTPFLFTYWIMPESFRWLVTKQRFEEAEKVIGVIAKVNKAEKPSLDKIFAEVKQETTQESRSKRFSFIDLFKTRESTKITLGLLFSWFATYCGYFGLTFGVKSLSGDFYLNMFLLNAVEAPVMISTGFLVNWFGRKRTSFAFYIVAGVTGIVVGVIQHLDLPVNGQLTNTIALVSKLCVSSGLQAMIVYTTELYPTVVRTIAYGVHGTAGRAGSMVAPQIVFLDDNIPGILYFLSGFLMLVSAIVMLSFKETKGAVLEDTLDVATEKDDKKIKQDNNEASKY